ncbi:MAG: alpha/beta fold hydrolase [Flavobacteriales bacterium]|jgi:pimeloyl-ACP methyl ester carboxylesterase
MDLYLLPGLGADHRLFGKLDLPGHTIHYLDWPEMPEGSLLRDYASVLAAKVDTKRPHTLIGVSMGGMVAQELAILSRPERVVIVSSWKGPQEMPPPLKLLRGTHPERILSKVFIQRSLPFMRWQMGVESAESSTLFDGLLMVHTLAQLKVQINACLSWDGPLARAKGLVHIHGDHDRLMPIGYIEQPIVVKGGGHFMVFDRAAEVSERIRTALTGS